MPGAQTQVDHLGEVGGAVRLDGDVLLHVVGQAGDVGAGAGEVEDVGNGAMQGQETGDGGSTPSKLKRVRVTGRPRARARKGRKVRMV